MQSKKNTTQQETSIRNGTNTVIWWLGPRAQAVPVRGGAVEKEKLIRVSTEAALAFCPT